MDLLSLSLEAIGGFMGYNDQNRLMKMQQAEQNLSAQRDRLAQVRQLRTQTANIQQAGANQGVGTSSAVAGGAGGVYSTAASNIGAINAFQDYGQNQTRIRSDIATDQGLVDLGKGLSDFEDSASKIFGGA